MAIEIVDVPINSMVIFHSFLTFFVRLPEGVYIYTYVYKYIYIIPMKHHQVPQKLVK